MSGEYGNQTGHSVAQFKIEKRPVIPLPILLAGLVALAAAVFFMVVRKFFR